MTTLRIHDNANYVPTAHTTNDIFNKDNMFINLVYQQKGLRTHCTMRRHITEYLYYDDKLRLGPDSNIEIKQ